MQRWKGYMVAPFGSLLVANASLKSLRRLGMAIGSKMLNLWKLIFAKCHLLCFGIFLATTSPYFSDLYSNTVLAIIHFGVDFVVYQLLHLNVRFFFGFVFRIFAAAGSTVGATFTSFGLWFHFRWLGGFLLPLFFMIFLCPTLIASGVGARLFGLALVACLPVTDSIPEEVFSKSGVTDVDYCCGETAKRRIPLLLLLISTKFFIVMEDLSASRTFWVLLSMDLATSEIKV